jgi:hypothetical protein
LEEQQKLLRSLEPEDIDAASRLAQEFVRGFVGLKPAVLGAATAIVAEFFLRHCNYSVEDLLDTIDAVRETKDETDTGGSVTLGVVRNSPSA